ncbi:hypothetical protein [Pedobacter nutrimenti]|uniref:Uncharacterized protein n=1 Tax=Pedobacter nutrimenti TaxID=1241337 RepID=A0A318UT61_9SPHI|nr:hypothetical protein [Pedobacter nutrimenti]PYF77285.1 hypothetical protein B0O44_101766 [Pedobacter nutrimenti]
MERTKKSLQSHFGLKLSLFGEEKTFVPMGIPDFKSRSENPYFIFEYKLEGEVLESLTFEVLDQEGQLIYSMPCKPEYSKPGAYLIYWDGFDNQDCYDSSRFNSKVLKAVLRAIYMDKSQTVETLFRTEYKEVRWLDVKIDRKAKKIEALLRTNLKDGGTEGLPEGQRVPENIVEIHGKGPLDQATKNFGELLDAALEGLAYHWGRNAHHPEAKNIVLDNGEAYQFFLKPDNQGAKTVKSPVITYRTNLSPGRSRNWEMSRILYYNAGYLKFPRQWYYENDDKAMLDFKHTAAHEIGHEILLAYGGHVYSKSHKGSSTIVTQSPLGNFLYPGKGEIDLMIYYVENPQYPYPSDYIKRSVAAEKDVLGLVWLSKLRIEAVDAMETQTPFV